MIILDLETTGLDPERHSIVSFGAVDFLEPRRQFYEECRIREDAEIQQAALDVNGFTEEQIRDPSKPSLEDALDDFIEWTEPIKDKTIAGQNPGTFDTRFLYHTIRLYDKEFPMSARTVDLHALCYAHHLSRGIQPPSRKGKTDIDSDHILEYIGLPEEPKPHNALNGAKWEAEAFSRLIHGEKLLEDFEQYEVPEYLIQDE